MNAARGGLACGLVLMLIASACGGRKYTTRYPVGTPERRAESVSASSKGLSASGAVAGDGTVSFTVAAGCKATANVYQKMRITRHQAGSGVPSLASVMIPMLGGLLGGIVGGMFVTIFVDVPAGLTMVGAGGLLFYFAGIRRLTNAVTRTLSTRTKSEFRGRRSRPVPCPRNVAGGPPPPEITVTTPWRTQHRATVGPDRVARVAMDWTRTGIDPHAPGSRERIATGWIVLARSGRLVWRPNNLDIDIMLKVIGRVTGNDVRVVKGGPPPLLEVVGLKATGGAVIAGAPTSLSLTVRNTGQGIGYRVSVRTRSSDPALHGLRFAMGSIRPGQSQTRRVTVNVPRTHKGGVATMVLSFSEANNNVPDQVVKRLAIRAGKQPQLTLACRIVRGGKQSNRGYVADAGAGLLLRCQLGNRGTATASAAVVTARLGAAAPKRSSARSIRIGGSVKHEIYLRVPASAQTGHRLAVVIDARESSMGASVRRVLTVEVGRQRICTPPISRGTYNRKLAKLRADLRQGFLDKATFDIYEAQLVGCLR